MKTSKFIGAAAVLAGIIFNCAYASEGISKAERQKAANAVGAIFGAVISPDAVKPSGLVGIYQVRVPQGPVFVSKDGSWVVQGNLFNVEKRENETDKAVAEMQKVKFADMPLDAAVKIVRGNGSRKLVTFEDVNCGYCKKLAAELERLDNVTIYVLPVAMIAPTSKEKALSVLCSDDPALAWRTMMVSSKSSPACSSKTKIDAAEKRMSSIQSQAEKNYVTGTPTLIFQDDSRMNGYIPVGEIDKRLEIALKSLK